MTPPLCSPAGRKAVGGTVATAGRAPLHTGRAQVAAILSRAGGKSGLSSGGCEPPVLGCGLPPPRRSPSGASASPCFGAILSRIQPEAGATRSCRNEPEPIVRTPRAGVRSHVLLLPVRRWSGCSIRLQNWPRLGRHPQRGDAKYQAREGPAQPGGEGGRSGSRHTTLGGLVAEAKALSRASLANIFQANTQGRRHRHRFTTTSVALPSSAPDLSLADRVNARCTDPCVSIMS